MRGLARVLRLPLLLCALVLVGALPLSAQTIRPKQVLIPDGTGAVLKMPSMTVAQRDATSHRDGEAIYCSDCSPAGVYFYFAGSWHASGAGGAGDVTHTGGLTLNALILGNVSADITALGSLGTTTTVLHGNAAGAPTWGAIVSADLNITTTSCTNQVVTALSAGAVGTCASVTNAMLAGSIAASKLVGTDIATLGTITAGVWNGTALTAAYGGTGQTTYTKGDLLVASAATTLTKLGVGTDTWVLVADSAQATGVKWAAAGAGTVTNVATTSPITGGPITGTGTIACATCTTNAAALTANALVIGGGGQATSALGSLGTTTTVLHGNAAGAPTFGAVSLTADVSGTLPVANGGTGATTLTIHGVLVGATTGPIVATAAGATGTVLAGTTGADPAFTATPAVTSVTTSGQAAIVIGPYGAGVGNTGEIRILELAANGTNYRGFKAPDAQTGNIIWTLPAADGTSGQCMTTDGAGILSWGACSGGGSGLTSLNGLTAATQTFANDTNVTMVSATSTHTITWSGTLAVARGGIGVGTLTANGVLLGNGTSAVTATAEGATGTVLQGTTGNPPAFTATPTVTGITTTGQAALALGPYGAASGNTGELRFLELAANGTNYIGFKAPNAITSNVIWTLPSADGTNLQCVVTNGSGTLSFSTCSAAAAPADPTFVTLSLNGTLTNERVLSVTTPITLADGGANSTITVACPTCVAGSGATGQTPYWSSASALAGNAAVINLKAYGTTGSNFNSAIAALPASGGTIYMPAGDYALGATTVTIDRPVAIIGDGRGITRLTSTANPAFNITLATTAGRFVLRDFSLSAASATTGVVVALTTAQFQAGRIVGTQITGGAKAVDVQTKATQVFIEQNYLGGTGDVVTLANAANPDAGDHYVIGNDIEGASSTSRGIVMSSAGLRMTGNKVYATQTGVYLTNGEFEISGNTILANGVATGGIAIDLVAPNGAGGRDFSITGNYLNGAQAATNSRGIRFRTTGTGTWASGTISGNAFRLVDWCIDIDGNVSWLTITGNSAQGLPGITVGNTATALYAAANQFGQVAATANYAITGTGVLMVHSNESQNLASIPAVQWGSTMYCANCTIANPCASGGSGAWLKRLNGVNVCS